jgi:hypothetical protein
MKKITTMLALAGLAAILATYAAADTIWDVDATFNYDGLTNTETGTFELGPSLNLVTWDITVTGTNVAADNVYDPGDSIDVFPDLTHLDFYDASTNQYANLYLQSPLTTSGGAIQLLYGDGGQTDNATIVCAGCGTLVSGSISAVATPEPSSIDLFIGAGIFGVAVLRKRVFTS